MVSFENLAPNRRRRTADNNGVADSRWARWRSRTNNPGRVNNRLVIGTDGRSFSPRLAHGFKRRLAELLELLAAYMNTDRIPYW